MADMCRDCTQAITELRNRYQHLGDHTADNIANQISKQCRQCINQQKENQP